MIKLTAPILLLVFSSFVISQSKTQSAKTMYSSIPPEDIFVVTLSQPDAPLRIENARLLFNLDSHQVEYSWDVRNLGRKSVSGYQIDKWWIDGTGGTTTSMFKMPLPKGRIRRDAIPPDQIIPLTDELRQQLKKDAGMNRLIVFVLKNVQFTDGSLFDGSQDSDNVRDYFFKVGGCRIFN
jgi:hypothetical protein